MKFIHTADLHLGMQPDKGCAWSAEREGELWETFRGIVDVCGRERCELLLIAGDMFHKQPLVRELKEADALFAMIPDTKVVIIAGNHDYISGMSNYNGFEWSPNVTFFKHEEPEDIYFDDINTHIYGLSFCHRQLHAFPAEGLKPSDPAQFNILLIHGGEPGNMPVNRDSLLRAGFDYIACGHIHIPLKVNERMRYSGAPEPLDRNDTGEHGYIMGEITEDLLGNRSFSAEFIPCSKRQYYKLDVDVTSESTQNSLKEVLKHIVSEKGEDNIYSFTLRGRRDLDIVFDCEELSRVGNIADITDRTVPDYDFERLAADNAGNIIGDYIAAIRSCTASDDIADKALEYGIGALLGHR